MYNCTIHVLRTDGGKEYVNVDPFCTAPGVRRQISEKEFRISNGKDERMHRIILNEARCMLFASGLPLYFGGDAAEYTAFVLNRSSCRSNTKRMPPIEMLTGTVPSLSDIVIFGSPCTVYRDPGNKAWKTRAEVGMIVGKNDETNGFKVYLPKDRVAQLQRENPELKEAIEARKDVTKGKEQSTVVNELQKPTVAKEDKKADKNKKRKKGSKKRTKGAAKDRAA
ncbi:Rve-domain-containing hypothetical protein [Phytophthora megakarya]|uniref:Integrase catalytic domain-containing protein n=1 Tax=Phytophthora megakarya TaxID=4795 RepID=A0A225X3F4_9STRA|nr:Rve-domain-containing hypothetical protein [Phytophthora megakarya]